MPYINKPIDRNQVVMTTLDAMVDPESTARIIDHFIDNVDLGEMGFKKAEPAYEGRPSYPPSNMIKLYLYGYENDTRSSRKLERSCKVNIEVRWLMEGLEPDFRTISDFRKDNIDCLKKLFHEFTRRVTVDLESGDVSIDGCKIKAWNSKDRNFTIHKLEERIKWIEDKTEDYLRRMDIADANEDAIEGELSREELEQKVKDLAERLERYQGFWDYMVENDLTQLSLTDAECRLMKMKTGQDTAYNVQTAVDTESHMMLDYNMTNKCTDHGLLAPTMEHIKEEKPDEVINVLADKGYHRDTDYIECLENGMIPNVIPDEGKDTYDLEIDYEEGECDPASEKAEELSRCLHAGVVPEAYKDAIEDMEVVEVRRKEGESEAEADPQDPERTEDEMKGRARQGYFVRDPERNCVYCPGGATLWKKSIKKNENIRYCNKKMCKQCPFRDKCVTSKKYPWKEIDFGKDTLEKRAKWWKDEAGGVGENVDEPERKQSEKQYESEERHDDGDSPGDSVKQEKGKKKKAKKKAKFHYKKVKKVRFKLRPNREKMEKRKCTSEHPNGTIKRAHGSDYFLLKGLQKVSGEYAMFALDYNLSRARNMFTHKELMDRVGRKAA